MGRPRGKRALVFLLCAALLFCLLALNPYGGHVLWATLVMVVTLLAALIVTRFDYTDARVKLQPLSFLSSGGCRAPPIAH